MAWCKVISIYCTGMQVMQWFMEEDSSMAGLRLCRLKNRFAVSKEDLVGGYRDLMFCMVYDGPHGLRIIGEVQIQDEKLYKLKLQVLSPTPARVQASCPAQKRHEQQLYTKCYTN